MEDIVIEKDASSVARAAAERFVAIAQSSVEARGKCFIALSGGSTPEALFKLLADVDEPYRGQVPWHALELFWGDERHVPPDDKDSNYRMTKQAMLTAVPLPVGRVHRVPAEDADGQRVAWTYEQEMRRVFAIADAAFPVFDLVMLGMGPDGHTASLFPESPGLAENQRWVIANPVRKFNQDRITITFPVIDNARSILFLITGKSKSAMLAEVIRQRKTADPTLPAARVKANHGDVTFLIDKDAAADLPGK